MVCHGLSVRKASSKRIQWTSSKYRMLCWPSHLTNEMTCGTNDWTVPRMLSLWSHPPRLSRVGHPCPGGVTGSSSEALWALPTYQWHWPWHAAALQHMKLGYLKFKTTCAVSSMAWNHIHLQCRSKISSEDSFSHVFKQLRKTECTFHVYHVGPFTDAWHSAPMLWGHKYGKSISWQNNELLLQISLCLKSFNPSGHIVTPAHLFHGSRSNRKTTANCRRINGWPPTTLGTNRIWRTVASHHVVWIWYSHHHLINEPKLSETMKKKLEKKETYEITYPLDRNNNSLRVIKYHEATQLCPCFVGEASFQAEYLTQSKSPHRWSTPFPNHNLTASATTRDAGQIGEGQTKHTLTKHGCFSK